MRVLHVLASNKYSGAENVVCQIISMFDGEAEMAYCSPDGQIRGALEDRAVAFYPIKKLSVKELKRVIKSYQPDIIHAHDMRASFVVSRSAGKIPYISHIHNNAFNSRGISLKSIAYLLAGLKAKHIFWVSESSFKGYKFHKYLKKKSSVLYNIINIDALYEKADDDENTYDYDIVYLGRLTYQKNPQRLMGILARVIEKQPHVKVAIIGTGELQDETKNLAKELKIDNNVDFLGFLSNPYKILQDAKVMLMSSRWEGTPMCALEAMALGVPIVSTPVDGLCSLIEDGKNGYLSDDDSVLAEKVVCIIDDENIYQELTRNTIAKAKEINDIASYKAFLGKIYKNV